ncbi:MAG: DMT family transporter [Anaerolineae bacterium]|nr:DMT family transporter [Anaerolineae bacterium]
MTTTNATLRGVAFLVLAMFILSLQNITVKFLGGEYPVLEIVVLRSIVALPVALILFWFEGGRGLPITKKPRLEYVRGTFLFFSYTTFFMGLAALPLADIEALRFSAPLMITFLSVVWLGERVGPWRWLALMVGFIGVLLIVRPGPATFNMGSVFVLIAMLLYALAIILTRKLQTTDSSATMAYYSTLVYLAAAFIFTPPVILVGDFPEAHPSVAFLFHPWAMPTLLDWLLMSGLGLVWAGGMYFIARAYSQAPASVVAPFEYISLPINIMWGFILWSEIPTWLTLIGAALTLFSGLYVLFREQSQKRAQKPQKIDALPYARVEDLELN